MLKFVAAFLVVVTFSASGDAKEPKTQSKDPFKNLAKGISIWRAPRAPDIDPLSKGPIALTAADRADVEKALQSQILGPDDECHLTETEKAITEFRPEEIPKEICNDRTRELVYTASKRLMVACLSQKVEMAIRISHGSNGLGKTVRGNRKSPVGTYWLGQPRVSRNYGIFIPVGYPNMDEIKKGYTGSDIGVHGPMRFLKCMPQASLAGNWTAGCLAMGRDTQVIELSRWILDHWPVKLTVKAE